MLQLQLWDLSSRREPTPPITSQRDRIWTLAFSPDGQLLASAGNNLSVALWKAGAAGHLVRTLGGRAAGDDFEVMPVGAAFNPMSTLLAASSADHSVTLWNVRSGRRVDPRLFGHTQTVSSVAFSGDGKTLASGGADDQIRLWDVETRELIGVLSGQQQAVHSITFAPGTETLASAGADDSIIFWDLDLQDWNRQACRIANRNLTRAEWNTYLGTSPYRKTCPDL